MSLLAGRTAPSDRPGFDTELAGFAGAAVARFGGAAIVADFGGAAAAAGFAETAVGFAATAVGFAPTDDGFAPTAVGFAATGDTGRGGGTDGAAAVAVGGRGVEIARAGMIVGTIGAAVAVGGRGVDVVGGSGCGGVTVGMGVEHALSVRMVAASTRRLIGPDPRARARRLRSTIEIIPLFDCKLTEVSKPFWRPVLRQSAG